MKPLQKLTQTPLALAAAILTTGGLLALSTHYEIRPVNGGVAQAISQPPKPSAMDSSAPQVPAPSLAGTLPAVDTSLQNLYVNISERMMPSVVNIFTTKNVRQSPHRMWPGMPPGGRGGGAISPEDFFGQFFGGGGGPMWIEPQAYGDEPPARQWGGVRRVRQQPAPKSVPLSLGTGFVVETFTENGKPGGLILTNHHVIAGADEVKVKFTESDDENEAIATVIGKDPELDIALLKVKTDRKLTPAPLGDSDRLKVGEWIAALGNPFGHGHSMSHGIVSAKERSLTGGFGKYLQVDAPINPGNSGGPLVNLRGEVVGINNAIDARGTGIGFAIPVNSVKAVLEQLKSGKDVERGYLGVHIMPLKPELARALKADAAPGTPVVAEVMPGTPADKAGIEPYDIITQIGGRKVKSTADLMRAVLEVPVGQKVKAEVLRGGKPMTFDVPVTKRPAPSRT
jgi:S1-C subfamily serine protease